MQVNERPTHDNFKQGLLSENIAVAVAQAGLTEIALLPLAGYERLLAQILVTGFALDQFVISTRSTPNAPFSRIYQSASDYLAPKGLLVGASGDLTTQAANTVGDFHMDIKGLYELKIEVSSGNAAGSTVSFFGSAV